MTSVKFFDNLKKIFSLSGNNNADKLASEFALKYDYCFRNIDLLIEALTHRSYTHYRKEVTISNERMEYLGDSVLGLVVADELFKSYLEYNEGDLTKTKSLLVNETTLSKIGVESGLNELIFMSPEEENAGGRMRHSIVSDAVEAVIAAIYLDGGLTAAGKFVRKILISHSPEILNDSAQRNYKGELLEYLQSKGLEPPHYEVVSEEGPDHEKTFEVVVHTIGKTSGFGSGPSKKEAEQKAASDSLKSLKEKESNKTDGDQFRF